MAEVAAVAVGADGAADDHAADLGLVARVADDGAELCDAVRELALVAVRARPGLLPLVAQLRLEHALAVHLELQPVGSRGDLTALLPAAALVLLRLGAVHAHEHALLLALHRHKQMLEHVSVMDWIGTEPRDWVAGMEGLGFDDLTEPTFTGAVTRCLPFLSIFR